MPTAARVVAALIVGFIAFVVAGQARAQLPEGMDPGRGGGVHVAVVAGRQGVVGIYNGQS